MPFLFKDVGPFHQTPHDPFSLRNLSINPAYRNVNWLLDFVKEVTAFFASIISVAIGIWAAWMAFFTWGAMAVTGLNFSGVCVGIAFACLVPVFLGIVPRYIYWWRYGCPTLPSGKKSAFFGRRRKTA
jgi:hypothetical protein